MNGEQKNVIEMDVKLREHFPHFSNDSETGHCLTEFFPRELTHI